MQSVAVFSGAKALDNLELRQAVVRIPEVSLQLREAQLIYDQMTGMLDFDWVAFLQSDSQNFGKNLRLQALAAAIVQIGLFARFRKQQSWPAFVAGPALGDSALAVISGQMSFAKFLTESAALQTLRRFPPLAPTGNGTLQLVGQPMHEYQAYQVILDARNQPSFVLIEKGHLDFRTLATTLWETYGATQFVNMGLQNTWLTPDLQRLQSEGVIFTDSVALDPQLSWFWTDIRKRAFALA